VPPLPSLSENPELKMEMKNCQNLLSKGDLHDALHNPLTLHSLKKFMARTFCEENLLFYKAVEDLKRTDPNSPEFKTLLEEIQKEYLKQGSNHEININGKTRAKILKAIEEVSDDTGKIELKMFDEAQNQIFMMISTNSWSAFLQSEECKKIMEGRRSASMVEAHNHFVDISKLTSKK